MANWPAHNDFPIRYRAIPSHICSGCGAGRGVAMVQPLDNEILAGAAPDLATAALALARRFAHGATLWCWAPGTPEHAQHVAVEFVHPVVVGTRALPAVALLGDDAAGPLRAMAEPGDVLLAVGGADAPVRATLRRGEAWGLTTMWLGSGVRPINCPADHLLWVSHETEAAHDGRLVLGYHVLWELTHVCFEHQGLLEETPATPVCTTCSDEGRLGEVIEAASDGATVRTAAGVETVSITLVGPVRSGDLVLVHAGTAITVVQA